MPDTGIGSPKTSVPWRQIDSTSGRLPGSVSCERRGRRHPVDRWRRDRADVACAVTGVGGDSTGRVGDRCEIAGSGEPLVLGRSYRDAPEVDGLVMIPGASGLAASDMLQVYINGAMEYDLVGEPLKVETFRSARVAIEVV